MTKVRQKKKNLKTQARKLEQIAKSTNKSEQTIINTIIKVIETPAKAPLKNENDYYSRISRISQDYLDKEYPQTDEIASIINTSLSNFSSEFYKKTNELAEFIEPGTKKVISFIENLGPNFKNEYFPAIRKVTKDAFNYTTATIANTSRKTFKQITNGIVKTSKIVYNEFVKEMRQNGTISLGIKIRVATMNDLEGICVVENKSFHPDDRYSSSTFKERLYISDSEENAKRKYFVAETKRGEIIGYGEVAMKDPSDIIGSSEQKKVEKAVGKLDNVVGVLISSAVDPDRRGEGIGTKLTKARLDYLLRNNLNQVYVQAWPNGGFPHIANKLGFKKLKGLKGRHYSDGSRQQIYFKYLYDSAKGRKLK